MGEVVAILLPHEDVDRFRPGQELLQFLHRVHVGHEAVGVEQVVGAPLPEAEAAQRGVLPGMLQDALAKRATEVAALNGGIVKFGQENGIPTPLNEAIWALILGLEHSWTRND